MTGDDTARLIYLGLLALVVGGSVFLAARRNSAHMASQAAIWVLIFLGVIAARGLWNDISHEVIPRQAAFEQGSRVEVPVSRDGHYYLTLELNETPVRFVVDTGASDMVLSRTDATRIGINPETLAYVGTAMTANGRVATAPVRIDSVVLGGVEDRNVRATVTDGGLEESLLGMGYLSRFSSLEIRRDMLVLTR